MIATSRSANINIYIYIYIYIYGGVKKQNEIESLQLLSKLNVDCDFQLSRLHDCAHGKNDTAETHMIRGKRESTHTQQHRRIQQMVSHMPETNRNCSHSTKLHPNKHFRPTGANWLWELCVCGCNHKTS